MWGELGPGMAHTCDSADATPCKGSVKAMKQISSVRMRADMSSD